MAFMEVCGADKELARAKELGRIIYYKWTEVPNAK